MNMIPLICEFKKNYGNKVCLSCYFCFFPQFLENVFFSIYTIVNDKTYIGSINWFNHISWMTVVTPTDRHKSVRNRCVIVLLRRFCAFWIFLLV